MSVTQVMEANARQCSIIHQQKMPLMGDASWLQWRTIHLGDDKSVIG
jgi:hypothetical protein